MPDNRHPPSGPRPDRATVTWLALLALTLLSVLSARHLPHPLWRLLAAATVALLCGAKAWLLIGGYLRSYEAGPVFHGLVRLFGVLAPTLLLLTALLEAGQALH